MEKSDEWRTRRDEQRRKYCEMDKRAKNKLVRSPREMEEDRMPQKIFTQELEGTRRRGRPRKRWKEELERDLQVLGVRRWSWWQIGQIGRTFFDRPKPTVGCSANGRRRLRMSGPTEGEPSAFEMDCITCGLL